MIADELLGPAILLKNTAFERFCRENPGPTIWQLPALELEDERRLDEWLAAHHTKQLQTEAAMCTIIGPAAAAETYGRALMKHWLFLQLRTRAHERRLDHG